MIWATEYKHVDLVKLLLSKGSDINIRDNVSVRAAPVSSAGRGRAGAPGPAASGHTSPRAGALADGGGR